MKLEEAFLERKSTTLSNSDKPNFRDTLLTSSSSLASLVAV